MKRVSVIVPVYNVEKYIEKCIDSILSQTYTNIELIIVNDGSAQDEDSIIRSYMDKDTPVSIKYIKKETNEGLFRARVTGVKASTGDYIEFVDGDDYIDADFVRTLVGKIEEDNADIAYATTVICSPEGKKNIISIMDSNFNLFPVKGDEAVKNIFYRQEGTAYFWHVMWNKIYRRELWDKVLPVFEKMDRHLVMLEDVLFSNILFYNAESLTADRRAVYYYCQHSGASTANDSLSQSDYIKKIEDISGVFDWLELYFKKERKKERKK